MKDNITICRIIIYLKNYFCNLYKLVLYIWGDILVYINKIIIQNFRQLKNVRLELQKDTTILAGPNNSGKTTIILLLKRILSEKTITICKDDFPVFDANEWFNKVYMIFKNHITTGKNKEKEVIIKNILDDLFPFEDKSKHIIIPECSVMFQIDYNDSDDIRYFADYIMDLDENKNSFYFLYKVEFNQTLFTKLISKNFDRIKIKFDNNENNKNKNAIDNLLTGLYSESLEPKCYFGDSKYQNLSPINNIQDFKNLFYFDCISAARPLGDSINKEQHSLSKSLVSLASTDQNWKEEIDKLPGQVFNALDTSKIQNKVKDVSAEALNETIKSISETNGNHTGEIAITLDVTEDNVSDLIDETTNAEYFFGDSTLNESSQGLGYSNLIYLHIRIQKYIKSQNPLLVNLLVIEEPESHMHPQMQNVFSQKLLKIYDENGLQGLITTHSNEIVKGAGLRKLRVIREVTQFNSHVFNLSSFINELKPGDNCDEISKDMLENFHDWFFEIGFSEVVFADAAILYEGDTERLYIKKLMTYPEYKKLHQKYIAFIQVGGAYAYNYKNILEFLKIKTLIITDIDYNCNPNSEKDVLKSQTTNSTLKNFYYCDNFTKKGLKKPDGFILRIEELYKWIKSIIHIVYCETIKDLKGNKVNKELIYLTFQTDDDKYTRTLEAAMISKKLGINGYDPLKRSKWIENKNNFKLKFSIPDNCIIDKKTNEREKDSIFTLWDILKSTSNSKTDFMYSVILNGYEKEMLPNYIKEGLKWLMV